MATTIKSVNKENTRFTINGKLAVVEYTSADKKSKLIRYSKGLTEQESVDFKSHLRALNII